MLSILPEQTPALAFCSCLQSGQSPMSVRDCYSIHIIF